MYCYQKLSEYLNSKIVFLTKRSTQAADYLKSTNFCEDVIYLNESKKFVKGLLHKNGFKIILTDPNVKSVLINIFGGIVRCDRVANGVIQAVRELNLNVGVVVRLQGTNAKIAKKILDESDIELISAETIDEAAKKAVGLVS